MMFCPVLEMFVYFDIFVIENIAKLYCGRKENYLLYFNVWNKQTSKQDIHTKQPTLTG